MLLVIGDVDCSNGLLIKKATYRTNFLRPLVRSPEHFLSKQKHSFLMTAQNTVHSILTSYKAKDLIDKTSELYKSTMYYQKTPATPVTLDANLSVRDASTVLAENKISSAPIVDNDKFM